MLRDRVAGNWRRRALAIAFSVAVVALVTGVVYALRPVAPVVSLGVLYVLAVVAVAIVCGLAYAIPVSVASMLVFNFLFLPPLHTFELRESENWVALAVYLITYIIRGFVSPDDLRLPGTGGDAAEAMNRDYKPPSMEGEEDIVSEVLRRFNR